MKGRFASVTAGIVGALALIAAVTVVPARPSDDLSIVSGQLEECDRGFCIGDRAVPFGAEETLADTPSWMDFNSNGVVESLYEELRGFIGNTVVVEVTDRSAVASVNGLPWSDSSPTGDPGTEVETATDPPITSDSAPPPPPAPALPASATGVVTGALSECGDGYCVGPVRVDFGPWWYLHHGVAPVDFNGDGVIDSPAVELRSFLGSSVTVTTTDDQSLVHVLSLNGVGWTDEGAPPPWTGGPTFGDDTEDDDGGGGPPPHAGEEDGDGPPPWVGGDD